MLGEHCSEDGKGKSTQVSATPADIHFEITSEKTLLKKIIDDLKIFT